MVILNLACYPGAKAWWSCKNSIKKNYEILHIVATSAFSNSMRHNSSLNNWIPMAILLDMIMTDLNSESLDGLKRTLIEFLSFLPGPERTTVKVLSFLPGPERTTVKFLTFLPGPERTTVKVLSFLPGPERTTVKFLTFLPGPKWTAILFPSWTQEKKKRLD